MKKIFFFILISFMFINSAFSQNQWFTYGFPNYSINADYITKPSFINAETGYVINGIGSGSRTIEVHKTVNKGLSWTQIDAHFPTNQRTSTGVPSIYFINSSTGYIITSFQPQGLPTFNLNILKTVDNGNNWTSVGFISNVDNTTNLLNPRIEFINSSLGYIWFEKGMFRTTDGGSNWTQILSTFGNNNGGYITKVLFDANDANTFYIGGGIGFFPGAPVLYKTSNQGSNFTIIANGSQPINNVRGIVDMSMASANKLIFATPSGIAKYENGTFAFVSEPLSASIFHYNNISAQGNKIAVYLQFKGSVDNTNKILYSEDNFSSYNVVLSFPLMERVDEIINKQSVFSYVAHNNSSSSNKTFFYLKEMNLSSKLLFDNINQTGTSTSFYIDDFTGVKSLTMPGNYSLFGGTMYYHVGYTNLNSGQQIFYKWQNAKLNPNSSEYIASDDYFIQANYKTRNISTEPTAISKAGQSKSLKDANGVINRIHTSLGGIFYSRSTNGGSSFFTEEIVNAGTQYIQQFPNADNSENNKNPSICEIRNSNQGAGGVPVSVGYPLNNVAAVWERYNPSTGKTEIKSAIRYDDNAGYRDWYKYRKGSEPNRSGVVTDFISNSTFKSKPVIFCSVSPSLMNEPVNYTYVIPHLEPDGSNTKIVVTVAALGNGNSTTQSYTITTGNIADFSVISSELAYPGLFTLHIVYKQDNNILYKKSKIGIDVVTGNTFGFLNWPQIVNSGSDVYTFNVSNGDGNVAYRYTPDISLRNGYPIVTYQGQHLLTRDYAIEDPLTGVTAPHSVTMDNYPIIVRWQNSNGWNGNMMRYKSSGTSTQQNPDIEGCTSANAYVLAYSKNNTEFKHVVKGDNIGNYYCNPPTFSGTDEKIVQGSYTSATGEVSRVTLTPSNTVYSLGQSNIDITDSYLPIYDNAYANVKGVVDYNATFYTFDLGPIIIKSTWVSETSEIFLPPEIIPVTNSVDFNEYMTSELFSLKNDDTLILGTAGCHSKPGGSFEPLIYRVNLLDINDVIVRELYIDTVTSEEEIMTEYYRGFIMDNIEGTQSYRVQLHLEDMNGRDASYTFSGVYEGDEVSDRGGNDLTNGIYVDYNQHGNPSSLTNIRPTKYSIAQNYPNPFNPTTTIKYSIPYDGLVQIKVYDIAGKEVMSLINENKVAGNYAVKFNGANLSSGIYFYRLNAGNFVQTKRMVLVK